MNTVNDTINQATGTTNGQPAQPQIQGNGTTSAGSSQAWHQIPNQCPARFLPKQSRPKF